MTPTTATPTSTVSISGTVANHSGSAQPISVQAWSGSGSSTGSISDSAEMQEFSRGTDDGAFISQQVGAPDTLSVANGATVRWTVSFPASDLGATALGVFPVAVQAAASSIGSSEWPIARTFLPFWPGNGSGVKPLQVSWIWPLIDTPQQGACTDTLATPELADSVKSGGRLNTLLSVGAANAQSDDLTWAIDPALLSDVQMMTSKYNTNGNGDCSGRLPAPADPAATTWLNSLKKATSDSESFLTPYANVDAEALAHAGLDGSILKPAYQLGDKVASDIVPDTFGKKDSVADGGHVLNAAMPAGGQADSETVGDLAIDGGVKTVILSNTLQSPAAQGNAIAKTISDTGTGTMSLLFADSAITSTLGSASANASASSQFNLTQTFLAETALIAAEYPSTARSLVIEPPTDWDPSTAEAEALLQETSGAQWLQPTKLSTLSAEAAALPTTTSLPPLQITQSELDDAYMDRVAALASQVTDFKELLYNPSQTRLDQLTAALAVTTSSAWRGSNSAGGYLALAQLRTYVTDAENDVVLIASPKILLAGQSGLTSFSVQNEFSEPIEVQVTGTPQARSGLKLSPSSVTLIVLAKQSHTTHITLSVSSGTLGTTSVHLQLRTMEGVALPGQPASRSLLVEATPFGHYLLIIIAAALGILVLTSVYRVRRKRAADAVSDSTPDETAKAGGAG